VREASPGQRPPWIVPGAFLSWVAPSSDANIVDCCVNANVLALMALIGAKHLPGYQPGAETTLRGLDWAGDDQARLGTLTPFYPSPIELLEALRHAVECGATELRPAADRLGQMQSRWSSDEGCCCSAYGKTEVWRCDALVAARARRASPVARATVAPEG
jgi:hypothetical protein